MARNPSAQAVIGIVGLYALARGIGQLEPFVTALAMLKVEGLGYPIIMDWVSLVAALGPLALLILGGVLLGNPPRRLVESPDQGHSGTYRAMLSTAGTFIIVLGLEQLKPLWAQLARDAPGAFRVGTVWAMVVHVLGPACPVGLLGLGALMVFLPPRRMLARVGASPRAPRADLPARTLWPIVAIFAGGLILATALPRLGLIARYVNMNLAPDAPGLRTYAIVYSCVQAGLLVFEAGLGVYLLLGAPRLMRWQIRKIESAIAAGTTEGPSEP